MRYRAVAGFALLHFLLSPAASGLAGDYTGVTVTKVLTATNAANGQKLSYLRTDDPEVTAAVVEIPPGGETGWHLHPVPVYAYILSGAITVEMAGGTNSYLFREGDAVFEVMNTPHNGRNDGKVPARLVVFYTGEKGRPNVSRSAGP